ncbi:helix-turn-helix domain-containing protein [Salibacterium aidingense]|uniref:helix-turn-helix domain-containing protein n=1 Tax=Salibacterium aidingense TaxID=384933 RepID=UPI003BC0B11A
MEKFGDRLRHLRKQKNITQNQLAKLFKISESAVGMYERNERNPSFDLVNNLAKYFEVTTDYLLGMTTDPQGRDSSIEKEFDDPKTDLMFKDWKTMTEEQKDEALEMMKYIKFKYGSKNDGK